MYVIRKKKVFRSTQNLASIKSLNQLSNIKSVYWKDVKNSKVTVFLKVVKKSLGITFNINISSLKNVFKHS